MAPKSIVVTGSAGFIGANFVRMFHARFPRAKIIGIDDFSTGRRDAVHPASILIEGSILDERLLDRTFKKHRPEYVFHFAALPRVSYSVQKPVHTSHVNIVGTVSVLAAAHRAGVRRVIYSSSSSVYGGARHLPTRESENPPNPRSPYALQKYTGEPFCRIFSDLYGLDTVCLRYFNVFGPGQYGDSPYSTAISAWLEALYFPTAKRRPFLEGDGRQSRDFCYVENVVRANILAMQARRPLRGAVMNVGHGERTDLRTVQKLIERYSGRKLAMEHRPPRPGDVRHSHADIRLAKRLIGYRPEVLFEEGIQRTVAWFESRIQ